MKPREGGAGAVKPVDALAYEPPRPAPLEWTPERMEVVVRGMGYVLHAVDPVADSPLAPDLWKMTEADAKAIAEPLSRIWNRYDTLRGAAGFSDEIGVAGAMAPYVKRNLAERGRAKAAHAVEEREPPAVGYQPETARQPETSVPAPVSEPGGQPEGQPGARLADPAGSLAGSLAGEEQPKAGVADAFEYALPVAGNLPPNETDRG